MDTSLETLVGLLRYPNRERIKLITKAYNFSKEAHKDQKRYSGEPYFTHVYETAKILAGLGLGSRTIAAGLLHDVLEDAKISDEELEKEFGGHILFIVQGVTKLGKIRFEEENIRHVESLRKFFVAMSKDLRVLIIKLADRLHNMRTLEHVPLEKQRRIATETMEIYVPLSHRMGMRKITRELEDLAFRYTEPEKYKKIHEILNVKRQEKEKELEKIKKSFLKAAAKEGITNIKTDTRLKSYYSVYQKLSRRGTSIDKIYDISALRVHVDTVSDCYRTLGVIHSLWRPLPGRIKDYIAFPKPNGYQSLHTTVFSGDGAIVEIQIRTHEMHERAEFGLASHIAYKEQDEDIKDQHYSWFKQFFPPPKKNNDKINPDIKEKTQHIPAWIQQLVDIQTYVSMPVEFMDNLKTDFFQHRMFIFDPRGEVIDLPIGSTPVDYAYELDPEQGNYFYGAKVNGKFVTLGTELHNGDIVEIYTKKSPQVNKNWLSYCKTTHARQEIKKALQTTKFFTE